MRIPIALALLLAGCATTAPAAAPAPADPAPAPAPTGVPRGTPASNWVELRSEHFTLRTDRKPAAARAYLDRLELTRAALLAAAWGGAKAGGRDVLVISFEQRSSLAPFNDEERFAGYVSGMDSALVLGGDGRTAEEVIRHELALELTGHFIPRSRQPAWFRRGLAELLNTIKIPDDAEYAEIGEADLRWVRFLNARGRMPTAELLALRAEPQEKDAFLGTSWLLTHYLYNSRTADFRKFQIALAQGSSPEHAWHAAFPDLTPEKLDQELTLYLKYGRYNLLRVPLGPVRAKLLSERTLSAAEEKALRARLYLETPGPRPEADRRARARGVVNEARELEPDTAAVLDVEREWADEAQVLADARAAAARHPDDPRAWDALERALERTHGDRAERERAVRRLAETAGAQPRFLNNAAWALAEYGDYAGAVPLARKAVELEPDPSYLDTLAEALAGSGQCAEAASTEERALRSLDATGVERQGQRFQAHLAHLREACHPAGP